MSLRPECSKPSSYRLTRFVIIRLLGFVYFVAFLAAANQIVPLVGEHGLLPANLFVKRFEAHFGSSLTCFEQLPGIFWFHLSDRFLVATAWVGAGLSLLVVLGYANAILMAVLWALYMSFIHIGQDWYGYGWEIQLLETGFLAIFLCPLLDGRPFPKRPPPVVILWLYRWLIFRIMLGAGLIKIRGDPCWRDLTCLYYHYETQPIPNPLSWWLHFRPHWFHQFGVLWNHFIELIVPWFAFWPRLSRHIAGALLVSFQIVLILSGNLSFLNWLTIVPALACFDDSLLRYLLPRFMVRRAESAALSSQAGKDGVESVSTNRPIAPSSAPTAAHEARSSKFEVPSSRLKVPPFSNLSAMEISAFVVAVLIAILSISPVLNMLSPGQIMNTSFDRFHLVNTYGAFGSVGQARFEIVFEGTDEQVITEKTKWREYEFKAKPGDPHRRPAMIAPYQPRIDWQIWFAAMATPQEHPWTLHFVSKLLHNDRGTLSLLANDPFPDHPPHYVRAQYYRYQFAPPHDPNGDWWKRTLVGSWLPPLSADDPRLLRLLEDYGWASASGHSK